MAILITGGAGFIGSNFVYEWVNHSNEQIINLDKLTYAGNLENLKALKNQGQHIFVQGDIDNQELVGQLLEKYQPRAIINFAAESHVDRSIKGPEDFVMTNVVGTFKLLEAARHYYSNQTDQNKAQFRFLHVSTDEVYGSLLPTENGFTEKNPYQPNSPYSASKASSDHFVRAYYHTYGLPVLTTNCSNNYGPFQFPEKLLPLIIHNALNEKPLPVYGDGTQVRDWLYVTDHCQAIMTVLEKGQLGEVYNVGGLNEKKNIEVVKSICSHLDKKRPRAKGKSYSELITFVTDRPGHDKRYAIDATKINKNLDWAPKETFQTGLEKTVNWYLDNQAWTQSVTSGEYRKWVDTNYAARG